MLDIDSQTDGEGSADKRSLITYLIFFISKYKPICILLWSFVCFFAYVHIIRLQIYLTFFSIFCVINYICLMKTNAYDCGYDGLYFCCDWKIEIELFLMISFSYALIFCAYVFCMLQAMVIYCIYFLFFVRFIILKLKINQK